MYSEIKEYLISNLSEERYNHTLSVCEECRVLSPYFGLSGEETDTLCLSALLHDITREKNLDAQIELCRVYNIDYTEENIAFPMLLHQKTGGAYARDIFGTVVSDEVIKNISTHTSGAPNMTTLQKLLFLADSTEPLRKHKSCMELRTFLHKNLKDEKESNFHLLDKACLRSLDGTIMHLVDKSIPIDIQTLKARNFLLLSEVKNNEKH